MREEEMFGTWKYNKKLQNKNSQIQLFDFTLQNLKVYAIIMTAFS